MNTNSTSFDILIIGGGHAGTEAAWAASHMLAPVNGRVALITMDPLAIGRMSCNPAIGGLAKGQIVREIDALGGLMPLAIDATAIQFRMLNKSKGPAVRSPRAQADKYKYAEKVQQLLKEHCPNLTIITGIADRLLTEENEKAPRGSVVVGVQLQDTRSFSCHAAILTTGTFLNATLHIGEHQIPGGRHNEPTAQKLSQSLRNLGFQLARLKTCTPPRLAKETINYTDLESQPGDAQPTPFSDMTSNDGFPPQPQLPMYITHTNPRTHEIIRQNLHRSAMCSSQTQSHGPRYCPSIEDKIVRFADKEHHQIFLEPEGLETSEVYCNGLFTSLPEEVQLEFVRSIKGLERAEILHPGYAVEYDFSPTHQIDASLETRLVANLFFAGQINGTSGYEEAAAQGLIAGINAANKILNKPRFILTRDQAYIGVMIDDLITKTPTEPYRMFTSRAEFRLTLRSDNADQRLTPLAAKLGLASKERVERLEQKLAAMRRVMELLHTIKIRTPDGATTAYDFLRRPDVTIESLREQARSSRVSVSSELFDDPSLLAALTDVEIEAKYAGYIQREKESAKRLHELEGKTIPAMLDFSGIQELRKEARQALTKFRPQTLGQASRLEGITPNDLTVLLLHLRKR
ncbi:MAG: tRNA uridine-5-carboxymethylaminomethyl(34) synthesis enzyme MnmG [Phycisphaerales bacterium]|nr:tRNA uridine-5-carboxymethylaminomethyl(34) synthesis enzyme MnmG [Phycisphaerales bacterium]